MGKVTVPKGFEPRFVKHWYLVANQTDALFYEGKADGTFRFLRRLRNVPPEEVDARQFAHRIAAHLEHGSHAEVYSDLVIMAEPKFLGQLNQELSKRVMSRVRRELPSEWAQGSDGELEVFLREKLAS